MSEHRNSVFLQLLLWLGIWRFPEDASNGAMGASSSNPSSHTAETGLLPKDDARGLGLGTFRSGCLKGVEQGSRSALHLDSLLRSLCDGPPDAPACLTSQYIVSKARILRRSGSIAVSIHAGIYRLSYVILVVSKFAEESLNTCDMSQRERALLAHISSLARIVTKNAAR